MNYIERIKYYLNEDIINNKNIDKRNLVNIKSLKNNKRYDIPLGLLLLRTRNHKKLFKFRNGDISLKETNTTLTKNRILKGRFKNEKYDKENNTCVILRCLAFNRHWGNFYNKLKDIPFRYKKNCIFWRGTTNR